MAIIDEIFSLFHDTGQQTYAQEPISQLEHAIQTAMSAQRHHARPAVIAAALLHDIGHLLPAHRSSCPQENSDCHHEIIGAEFIHPYFIDDVAELVKQHVNAKRYLVAMNSTYAATLSMASIHTLALQGGTMSIEECNVFMKHHCFKEIILLRHWDEAAKIPNRKLPTIESFASVLAASLRY